MTKIASLGRELKLHLQQDMREKSPIGLNGLGSQRLSKCVVTNETTSVVARTHPSRKTLSE